MHIVSLKIILHYVILSEKPCKCKQHSEKPPTHKSTPADSAVLINDYSP